MGDYADSVVVVAPPDAVLDYLSDISNLPRCSVAAQM